MNNATTKLQRDNGNATRSVRVSDVNWLEAKREALDRRTNIITLFGVAWSLFFSLPESKREKLVRDIEQKQNAA